MLCKLALSLALSSCASTPRIVAPRVEPLRQSELPALLATALHDPSPVASTGEITTADGRTRTLPRACSPDAPPAGNRVFSCTSTSAWPRREWSFEGDGRVIDVRSEMALIARYRTLRMTARSEDPDAREPEGATVRREDVVIFEIDRARWIIPQMVEPTASFTRVGFTESGGIVGIVRTGRATAIVHGAVDEMLHLIVIDRPADDIARSASGDFVLTEGDRAFVIGPEGLSVRAVTLPEGSVLSRPSAASGPRRAGERIRCHGNRCTLDERVSVTLGEPSLAAIGSPIGLSALGASVVLQHTAREEPVPSLNGLRLLDPQLNIR